MELNERTWISSPYIRSHFITTQEAVMTEFKSKCTASWAPQCHRDTVRWHYLQDGVRTPVLYPVCFCSQKPTGWICRFHSHQGRRASIVSFRPSSLAIKGTWETRPHFSEVTCSMRVRSSPQTTSQYFQGCFCATVTHPGGSRRPQNGKAGARHEYKLHPGGVTGARVKLKCERWVGTFMCYRDSRLCV